MSAPPFPFLSHRFIALKCFGHFSFGEIDFEAGKLDSKTTDRHSRSEIKRNSHWFMEELHTLRTVQKTICFGKLSHLAKFVDKVPRYPLADNNADVQ